MSNLVMEAVLCRMGAAEVHMAVALEAVIRLEEDRLADTRD